MTTAELVTVAAVAAALDLFGGACAVYAAARWLLWKVARSPRQYARGFFAAVSHRFPFVRVPLKGGGLLVVPTAEIPPLLSETDLPLGLDPNDVQTDEAPH